MYGSSSGFPGPSTFRTLRRRARALPSALIAQRHIVGFDNHLADRPERDPGKLQMRPSERDADNRDGQKERCDQMAERQPPAREHEPDDVADKPQRSGAHIGAAE